MPLQPLPAPSTSARTLTAVSRPPRVPTTRKVPAPPHQEHPTDATSSSSSSSKKRGPKKAARFPRNRCEELQQALELEWGSEHRLKPSQLTAALERYLADRPNIDLRARAAELRAAVGLELAAGMVHSYPRILLVPAPDILKRLQAWAEAFAAEPDSILALVNGFPGAAAVLTYAPESAKAKVATLCAVLRVGRNELLGMCTKTNRLMTVDHKGIPARLATLGDALGLTPEQVADMCKRCPSCLSVDPSAAVVVCRAVAAALEVEWEEAVRLCYSNSSVLSQPSAKVAEVARWLKTNLGLIDEIDRYLFLFNAPPEELTPRLEALPAALGITREEGLRLVQDAPRLLLLPTATVSLTWGELRLAASMRAEWRVQIGGWAASTLTRNLHAAGKITQRGGAVVALNPAPQHLPSLSVIMVQNDAKFSTMLQNVQQGKFKAHVQRAARQSAHSIRACHPALWRQL